jgi:hypothetical protein
MGSKKQKIAGAGEPWCGARSLVEEQEIEAEQMRETLRKKEEKKHANKYA